MGGSKGFPPTTLQVIEQQATAFALFAGQPGKRFDPTRTFGRPVVQQPPMPIKDEIVEAFLRCETKAYLKFNGTSGAPSDLSRWQHSLREKYREECYELLRVGCDALCGLRQ